MPVLRISIVLFSFFILSVLPGCTKDPETIIKTVTVTDTLVIIKTDTLTKTDTVTVTQFIQDTTTTFILSRHAETTGIGSDPSLSVTGQERATELARVLKNTPIQAVYATNYNRTKETAAKISATYGLSTQIYDPAKLDALAISILQQYKNKVIYISGHSNTTNVMLNVLVGSNVYPTIPDSEYDNLYIVSVSKIGSAKVVHLKYGK